MTPLLIRTEWVADLNRTARFITHYCDLTGGFASSFITFFKRSTFHQMKCHCQGKRFGVQCSVFPVQGLGFDTADIELMLAAGIRFWHLIFNAFM